MSCFNERAEGHPLSLIILHYTGMKTADAALERLCDPRSKVSAHYLIEKGGKIHPLVDETKRAWHAGVSFWKGKTDINSLSIGIELDNGGHDFGLPRYPDEQINSLLSLLQVLVQKYRLSKNQIIGHSDIAPLRKKDPGEHFPWETLCCHGFGLWPEETPVIPIPYSLINVQEILGKIGYDCPVTGAFDHKTIASLQAFQRHFTPWEITGTITPCLQKTLSRFKKD